LHKHIFFVVVQRQEDQLQSATADDLPISMIAELDGSQTEARLCLQRRVM
jgi:hypothetical protein